MSLENDEENGSLVDVEDREIRRLEKLLGITKAKDRKRKIAKLNEEYAEEGIGEDFGSFLMELDDLITGNSPQTYPPAESNNNEEQEDDPEQSISMPKKKSKIEKLREAASKNVKADGASGTVTADISKPTKKVKKEKVAPAEPPTEQKSNKALQKLQRHLNGLINRLTEETLDETVRQLKALNEANNPDLVTKQLLQCMFAHIRSSPQKIMVSLLLFASCLALLGRQVVRQTVVHSFHAFAELFQPEVYESNVNASKVPHTTLLLVTYLYSLQTVPAAIIFDLIRLLLNSDNAAMETGDELSFISVVRELPMPLRIELTECILFRVGERLRKESTTQFTTIVQTINTLLAQWMESIGPAGGFSRTQFLLEAMVDFDGKAALRQRTKHNEEIKIARKNLQASRRLLPRTTHSEDMSEDGEHVIPLSLVELLGAASHAHSQLHEVHNIVIPVIREEEQNGEQNGMSNEQAKLERMMEKNALQLRLNNPIRKQIFAVIMQCRDVMDAYEQILSMRLGSKMDRDLVRVLLECCAKEKDYNPFYVELLKLFCDGSNKTKLSIEHAYNDEMQALLMVSEEEIEEKQSKWERRAINNARMLSELVMSFKLSLTVLRKVEITEINELLMLFLSTFFVSLFTHASADTELEQVCDRLGRSQHYEAVRQVVLLFLTKYMKELPPVLNAMMAEKVKMGRKKMMRTMKDLAILNYDQP